MSNKTAYLFIISVLLLSSAGIAASAKSPALQVYLPSDVMVSESDITLGNVCELKGEPSLAAKASPIRMGQITTAQQEIVIDRQAILSRLASNGIFSKDVVLTGADKMVVKRQHWIISADEIIDTAKNFLANNLPKDSVCSDVVKKPADIVIFGEKKNVKLIPTMYSGDEKSQVTLQVGAVTDDNKQISMVPITFRLRYKCHNAVASGDIQAGDLLTLENIKIQETISDKQEPEGWNPPYGFVAYRKVASGTIIKPDMIGPAKPAVVVERNKNVIIRIDRPNLMITAVGKALQKGAVGECIKVQNIESQRIIFAKVNIDGTVEPIF